MCDYSLYLDHIKDSLHSSCHKRRVRVQSAQQEPDSIVGIMNKAVLDDGLQAISNLIVVCAQMRYQSGQEQDELRKKGAMSAVYPSNIVHCLSTHLEGANTLGRVENQLMHTVSVLQDPWVQVGTPVDTRIRPLHFQATSNRLTVTVVQFLSVFHTQSKS